MVRNASKANRDYGYCGCDRSGTVSYNCNKWDVHGSGHAMLIVVFRSLFIRLGGVMWMHVSFLEV